MRRNLAIIGLLFLLPLILFWPQTVGGQTLLPTENLYQFEPYYSERDVVSAPDLPHNHLLSDLVLQNLQWRSFTRESITQGEIPLWNPHQFSGIPFLAAGQQQVLYPLSVIYYVLPLPLAYGWFTVINLWLAGVFMFGFLRALGVSHFGGTLSGITYQLAAMFITSAVFPMIIGAAVWLPLILTACEFILKRRTLRGRPAAPVWAAMGGVALAFSILSGHAELTIYTLLIAGYYSAFRLVAQFWRSRAEPGALRVGLSLAGWLLLLVIIGFLLGAVQLIPLFEFVQTNWRAERTSLETVLSYAHKPRDLIQFILPNFYGSPAIHGYFDLFTRQWQPALTQPDGLKIIDWGIKNYVESALYVGILPLALAVFALFAPGDSKRPPLRPLFAGLGVLSLTFMFGLPTYALIYVLPGINQLNSPFRWIYGVTVAVAVLAGFGADAVARHRGLARYFGWALVGTGNAMLLGTALSFFTFDRWSPVLEPVLMGMEKASNAFSDMAMFFSFQVPNILILALMSLGSGAVILLHRRESERLRPVMLFAVVLLAADLILASWGFNPASDPKLLDYVPPSVQFLLDQDGDWRYTVLNTDGQRDLLQANMTMRYGLDDVRGYDSIIGKQYVDYMRATAPQNQLDFNRIAPLYTWDDPDTVLNSPRFKRLNVRFLVTHAVTTVNAAGWSEVYSDDVVRIYEDSAFVPRAYTVTDVDPFTESADSALPDIRAIALTSETGREKTLTLNITDPVTLVLSETYAPGWKAFLLPVDAVADAPETELAVEPAYENFIAVRLDKPGDWTIRLVYSPASFTIGAFISVLGVGIALGTASLWLYRVVYGNRDGTGSLARNTIVPIAANLFNRGVDFAFIAVLFRVFGAEQVGYYYYAVAIFGWFDILSNFGLDLYTQREASRARDRSAALFAVTSQLRWVCLLACVPLLLGFIAIRQSLSQPLDSTVLLTIGLFLLGLIPGTISKGLSSLYYAFERAQIPAAITTLSTLSKVSLGFGALTLGWGAPGLAGMSILTNLLTLGILAWLGRDMIRGWWQIRQQRGERRAILGHSWPLMLNHLLATIFFQIDIVLLEAIKGARVVGLYRIAYSWLLAINVIPAFYTQALMTRMSALHNQRDELRSLYVFSIKLLIMIALPAAVLLTALAEPLTLILGGADYLPEGAIAIQIMVWSIPIGWMNSLTQYALVAVDLHRRVTVAFAVACGFNIITNLIFIPMFGFQAAAVTTIFSELVLFLFFGTLMSQALNGIPWLPILWRLYASVLVMGATTVVSASVLGLYAGVVLGSVAYVIALRLLKPFSQDELARIIPKLPSRLWRVAGYIPATHEP
jgi:O-antigen/teichoic acid export membrane protein